MRSEGFLHSSRGVPRRRRYPVRPLPIGRVSAELRHQSGATFTTSGVLWKLEWVTPRAAAILNAKEAES